MRDPVLSVANILHGEDGATAVEYAILVAAIATVIVVITLIVGAQIENAFNMLCKSVGSISGGVTC